MDGSVRQLFHRYNPWWSGKFRLSGIIPRERILGTLKSLCSSKEIVIITGLRRIGKTTLMRMLIKHLVSERRVDPKCVFYITLDDYSLRGETLAAIIDEYRSLHKLRVSDEISLFLDEVTAMPDYEVQLKNLFDLGSVKIFASSSSASVLRSGKAHITGRHKVVEIPPLDFEEYLQFKRIVISPMDGHLRKVYFEDFLKTGGIPEYVLTGDIAYLHQLVDNVICKDIAAFHGIKSVGVLKNFFLLLMERAGKSVSVNKLARILDI
ncbi:MAG: ATP-binding protein, partial [Victivallales bacterium]|nr:ATP-binding protein [Victivallales bacterium]